MLAKSVVFFAFAAVVLSEVIAVDDGLIVLDTAPEKCEPGRKYKIDCNICGCSEDMSLACSKMKCVHPPPQKRSASIGVLPATVDIPEVLPEGEECEVGKTYKQSCNFCVCTKGGNYACTMQACGNEQVISDYVEGWGPLWTPGTPCEPNKQFYSQCNRCTCSPDGKNAICTLKACIRPVLP